MSKDRKQNSQIARKDPPAGPKQGVKPYEPTKREKSALEAFDNRMRRQKPAPRFKVVSTDENAADIRIDHKDQAVGSRLLLEATGTADADFLEHLIGQLADVGRSGKGVNEKGLNFMLSVVTGIEPRDQMEAMLAAQMAAV